MRASKLIGLSEIPAFVDKAADSLEDTGPLSVIGIMANQFGL